MYVAESLFGEVEPAYRTRIYFGLSVCGTRVKIGLTGRKSGRRGGELHFEELASVPGDRITERQYHDKYAADRVGRTEWFYLSDALVIDLLVLSVQQGRHKSSETVKSLIRSRLGERDAA